jgi:hypothetical protein
MSWCAQVAVVSSLEDNWPKDFSGIFSQVPRLLFLLFTLAWQRAKRDSGGDRLWTWVTARFITKRERFVPHFECL